MWVIHWKNFWGTEWILGFHEKYFPSPLTILSVWILDDKEWVRLKGEFIQAGKPALKHKQHLRTPRKVRLQTPCRDWWQGVLDLCTTVTVLDGLCLPLPIPTCIGLREALTLWASIGNGTSHKEYAFVCVCCGGIPKRNSAHQPEGRMDVRQSRMANVHYTPDL